MVDDRQAGGSPSAWRQAASSTATTEPERCAPSTAAQAMFQHAAIGLIEDAVAPWDPRLAIVACWNVACAATLRKYLPVEVVEVLEGAWRRAIGEPPA